MKCFQRSQRKATEILSQTFKQQNRISAGIACTTAVPVYKTYLIQGSAQNCLSDGYSGAELLARMQYKCSILILYSLMSGGKKG